MPDGGGPAFARSPEEGEAGELAVPVAGVSAVSATAEPFSSAMSLPFGGKPPVLMTPGAYP